jgi:hypothetical protein
MCVDSLKQNMEVAMSHSGNWSPYVGSNSIILAVVLFIVTGVLVFLAMRVAHPITVRRPGKALGISIVVIWVLSVVTFLLAVIVYALALVKQDGHIASVVDPITPITVTSGMVSFVIIGLLAYFANRSGFRAAIGAAIVGTIAAPMIFELPFDLIVMWHTFPPAPAALFTPLFFFPLFIVEIASFAMLMLSPVMKLSRYSLFLLAGMFLIFAVWALFGFAYPLAPLPFAMNVSGKILAFATAVSLFLPAERSARVARQGIDQMDGIQSRHPENSVSHSVG